MEKLTLLEYATLRSIIDEYNEATGSCDESGVLKQRNKDKRIAKKAMEKIGKHFTKL